MKRRTETVLSALVGTWLLAGCAFDLEYDDLEIGEESAALVRKPRTNEVFWSVWLSIPGTPSKSCTGSALTDHWIITAAHCVEDAGSFAASGLTVRTVDPDTGATLTLYNGGAYFYPHPDYDPGWDGVDGNNDIGLILVVGDGMAMAPRADLYFDDREPWMSDTWIPPGTAPPMPGDDAVFHVVGYGLGSDPDGYGTCTKSDDADLDLGIKRISDDNLLYPLWGDNVRRVYSWNSDTGICFGDSGSAWMLPRGNRRLAFAISSYKGPLSTAYATLIRPKYSWILETAASTALPIQCYDFFADGYRYKRCEDDPVFIWLDAEYGTRTFPMTIGTNSFASQAKYIYVPNGAPAGGSMTYQFTVPREADYYIWGRVISNSGSDDSFWVSVDGGLDALWDTAHGGVETWVWDRVSNRSGQDPVVYHLDQGTHTLQVTRREDGTKLDRVLVTSVRDFIPYDRFIEAEDGALTFPMRTAIHFGGVSIWVPNGAGSGGAAEYDFEVPMSSQYRVLGRVSAPSPTDDSFFASMDGSFDLLWDTTRTSAGSWAWDQVSHRGMGDALFLLTQGDHTLEIKRREDGTRLDRILITNDHGFVPKDAAIEVGVSLRIE